MKIHTSRHAAAPWLAQSTLLAALFASFILPGCAQTERHTMEPQFQIILPRNEVVVGETTPFTLVVTNPTDRRVTMPDPQRDADWPKIQVTNLGTGESNVYGQFDSEKTSEFTAPRTAPLIELAPREEVRWEHNLLRWIDHLDPGRYELTGLMKWEGGEIRSKPVSLTVQMLNLRGEDVQGAHSGHTTMAYAVWSHGTPNGSVLFMSGVEFGAYDRAIPVQYLRVAEVDGTVQPVLSVTPNRRPHPAQWIVWLNDGGLAGLCMSQWRVKTPVRSHRLKPAASAIVSPVLLDPATESGLVALWSHGNAGESSQLTTYTLKTNGSLVAGPVFATGAGVLRWSRAAALNSGIDRFVLAVEHGSGTSLELAGLDGSGHALPFKRLTEWAGSLIGAGMALDENDTMHGAAVLRETTASGRTNYVVRTWQIAANGDETDGPPSTLALKEPGLEFGRAIVALSPAGRAAILLHTHDQKCFSTDGQASPEPLPAAFVRYGSPVGLYALDSQHFVVLLAARQTGVSYVELPGK